MQLNIEQRFYIVEHFFRTSSVKQTIRNFYSTFNRKIFPKTVKQTILRLRQTGSLHNRPKLGRPTVIDDALIEKIRQEIIYPGQSVRKVGKSVGVSRTTVQKVAKKILKFHPYRMRLVKELKPSDFPLRIEFGNWILGHPEIIESDFFFMSDESNFYLDGHVNRHNFVYWNDHCPENHFTDFPTFLRDCPG